MPKLPDSILKATEPLQAWAQQSKIGGGILIGAAVAVVILAFMLYNLTVSSKEPEPNYILNMSPQPTYTSTYPSQIFTAKPVPRATIAATIGDSIATSTFRGFERKDLKNLPKFTDVSATTQAVVKDRQYLAQRGYSWSPEGFLSSARKGDLDALKTYLRAGMPPGTRNAFSSTALHAAAESNNIEAAKILIAAGADVNMGTTNLQTPLHRAVAQNLPAMAQLLIFAGANPKATTLEGWTPMFYAVDNNNQALMESLIAAGTNVNAADRFGNTALMIAVRKNYISIAQRLIYLGAKINVVDLSTRTPLHYAVSGGYYQLTKMLLENGARADARDKNGLLPMDIALANQDLALANLLLANGSKRPQVLGTKARGITVPPDQKPAPLAPKQPAAGQQGVPVQAKTYNLGPSAQPQQQQQPQRRAPMQR